MKEASLIPSAHQSSLYSPSPSTIQPIGWVDAIPCVWRPKRFEKSGTLRLLMPWAFIKFVRIQIWCVHLVACAVSPFPLMVLVLYSGSVPKLSQMDFSECPIMLRQKGPWSSQGKLLAQSLSVCLTLSLVWANKSRLSFVVPLNSSRRLIAVGCGSGVYVGPVHSERKDTLSLSILS